MWLINVLMCFCVCLQVTDAAMNNASCTVAEGDGETQCTACQVGFVMDFNVMECIGCPGDCEICELDRRASDQIITVCRTCYSGFYLTDAGICSVCPDPCSECEFKEPEVICTACNTGYAVTGYTCTPCGSNCDSCLYSADYTSYECADCASGFGIFDGVCLECTESQVDVCYIDEDGTQTVLSCIEGYTYVDTSYCHACPSKCLNCSQNICTRCETGYRLTAAGSCAACSEGCLNCYRTTCNWCDVGYVLDAAGTCLACSDNCADCMGDATCYSCNYGYTRFNWTCIKCPDHCSGSSCWAVNETTTICSTCETGYYLDSPANGTCTQCPAIDGCDNCTAWFSYANPDVLITNITCGRCQTGYEILDGECIACGTGCDACSVWTTGGVDQSSCYVDSCAAYYSYNTATSRCQACPPYCSSCYYSNSTSTMRCNSTGCDSGFGFNSTSGKCAACPARCSTCKKNSQDIMMCTACDDTYGLRRGCIECPAHCSSCVDEWECSACKDGYTIQAIGSGSATVCRACWTLIGECTRCTTTGGDVTCSACQDGYSLSSDGKSCLDCTATDHCASCTQSQSCSSCPAGYIMDDSGNTCTPGCYTCVGDNCGVHISEGHYGLTPCNSGTCWVTVQVKDGVTSVTRSCLTTQCTEAYTYRVCTKYRLTGVMECSRCCSSGGCNGFLLVPLMINGGSLPSPSHYCVYLVIVTFYMLTLWNK